MAAQYDALVVGAGGAGLRAAFGLAEAGLKVSHSLQISLALSYSNPSSETDHRVLFGDRLPVSPSCSLRVRTLLRHRVESMLPSET